MFCDQSLLNPINDLSCSKRLFSEIISIISLIFSFFVVFVTLKKVKMNLTNQLILDIIVSEILDGINILLAIVFDLIGKQTFENYVSRMGLCFTQIYLGIFTCLWTLTCSFFISLRIYDRMVNRNRIFNKKFMSNNATILSFVLASGVSYILWSMQINQQSSSLKEKSIEEFYSLNNTSDHFRHMYCWVGKEINIVIFTIATLLIVLNIIFSVFKGYCFVKRITDSIKGYEKRDNIAQKGSMYLKIKKMNHMMRSLILYPLVSGLVWLGFFVMQIVISYTNVSKNGIISWFYCGLISLRQLIYTLLFFCTQGNVKKKSIEMLVCKENKEKKDIKGNNKIENKEKFLPREEKNDLGD